MNSSEQEPRCPYCGSYLDEDDVVYTDDQGRRVGCQNCIHEEYLWQHITEVDEDAAQETPGSTGI